MRADALLELFQVRVVDLPGRLATPLRVLAPQLPNRDEVPHPVFSEYWVQGSPLPRVRGAQPALRFALLRAVFCGHQHVNRDEFLYHVRALALGRDDFDIVFRRLAD